MTTNAASSEEKTDCKHCGKKIHFVKYFDVDQWEHVETDDKACSYAKPRRKNEMNVDRRIRLDSLISEISDIKEEEEEALDNLPESIQESEKGEEMQEHIDDIEEAIDCLLRVTE